MLEVLILNKYSYIFFLISYLIGSIPFGYLIFKFLKKKDIRRFGSGNIGATNVNRLLGKKLAALTLFLDFFKTFLPTFLAYIFLGIENGIVIGALSIIGHIFPVWIKFKGGKGVASFIGYLLVVSWPLCLIFISIWLLSVKVFRYSALGAIVSIISNLIIFKTLLYLQFNLNFLLWIPGQPIEFNFILLISIIILLKHSKNIKSLIY